MDRIESLRSHAVMMPTLAKFAIGMAALSRLVCLPSILGRLLAGAVTGRYVLDGLGHNRSVAAFFADLGKLLLMFFAGLEIDLARFRQAKRRTAIFGVLTMGLPLLLGTGVGILFGYGWIAAIVLRSLLASQPLSPPRS